MPRKTISIDDVDNFSIDPETRQLFWYGNEIMTTMRLPWWVNVSAVLTGASTFGLLIVGIIALVK